MMMMISPLVSVLGGFFPLGMTALLGAYPEPRTTAKPTGNGSQEQSGVVHGMEVDKEVDKEVDHPEEEDTKEYDMFGDSPPPDAETDLMMVSVRACVRVCI